VVFAGRIPENEKIDHYNLADAFAMPSKGEGFGFVFLEAAGCGLPVLGGNKDGSVDALVDGRLGVLIDPDDPADLLQGLIKILRTPKHIPDCLEPFNFPHFQRQFEDALLLAAGMTKNKQVALAPIPQE
jgi:phosphatidylinositol alpha-1,6-mannosyltransferase